MMKEKHTSVILTLFVVAGVLYFFAGISQRPLDINRPPATAPQTTSGDFVQGPLNQVQAPDESSAIATAVKSAGASSVTVLKIDGNYAMGAASGRIGGMWLATKVSGIWKMVWGGSGNLTCAIVNRYNFPSTLIHSCWDEASQKVINR
jgi:hypothetical protein